MRAKRPLEGLNELPEDCEFCCLDEAELLDSMSMDVKLSEYKVMTN